MTGVCLWLAMRCELLPGKKLALRFWHWSVFLDSCMSFSCLGVYLATLLDVFTAVYKSFLVSDSAAVYENLGGAEFASIKLEERVLPPAGVLFTRGQTFSCETNFFFFSGSTSF